MAQNLNYPINRAGGPVDDRTEVQHESDIDSLESMYVGQLVHVIDNDKFFRIKSVDVLGSPTSKEVVAYTEITSDKIASWDGKQDAISSTNTLSPNNIKDTNMNGKIAAYNNSGVLGSSGIDTANIAVKSEMSIADGTGADAGTATIQLKSGTSKKVLTQHQSLDGKVDKVTGKVLSTNDYDNIEKGKVANAIQMPTGASSDKILGYKNGAVAWVAKPSDGQDGEQGPQGEAGHNPCLGRFTLTPSPMPTAQVGDYLYVDTTTTDPNTQEETTTTTVYHYGNNGWDSGTVIDAEHPTLASGQTVTSVHIKDLDGEDDPEAQDVLSADAGKVLNDVVFGEYGYNTIDVSLAHDRYHLYTNNKVKDEANSAIYAYCAIIPCQSGDKFRIFGAGLTGSSATVGRLWAFTNGTLTDGYYGALSVSGSEANSRENGVEITAPEGSVYLFVNFFEYDSTKDYIQKWEKSVYGLVDKTKFESGQNISETSIVDNLTTDSANDVLSAKQGKILGNEIYDTLDFVDIAGIQENKYYNTDNNPIGVNPLTYADTGCIRVECAHGDVFKLFGVGISSWAVSFYAWTDSSRNRLERYSSAINCRIDGLVITAPENARYLYVNFSQYNSATDKIQKQVVTNTGLKNKVAELETNLHSALFGKNIVVFGDSLSEFKNSDGKSWCDLAAEISDANFINVAIGGTQLRQRRALITLFDETKTYSVGDWVYYKPSNQMNCYHCIAEHTGVWSDTDFEEVTYNYYIYSPLDIINLVKSVTNTDIPIYADRFTNQVAASECVKAHSGDDNESIIARLSSIDWSDVNAVVIMAGANDFGELKYGTSGSVDINRTLGAINEMVRLLSSTYKNIPIYFVTETVRWFNYSGGVGVDLNWCDVYVPTGGTLTYKEFFAAISNEVIINHFPVIDLYNTLGWNKWNFSNFFNNDDGTHPYKGFRQIAERIVSGIIANKVF